MTDSHDSEFEDEYPEDVPRTAEEIARRALTLSAVITVAYGAPRKEVLRWLDNEGLMEEVSPFELKYLKGNTPDDARIPISWRVECLVVLLWCIYRLDELPTLAQQCDTDPLKEGVVFPPWPTAEYIDFARMRDLDDIYEEHETVYQAHWTVRDAQLNNKPMPKNLNPEVVYERHYAFNWVIGYDAQSWDDITTDT